MAANVLCLRCGGQMDEGKLQGFLNYVSDNASAKFWSWGPEVRISRARVCLSCGYIELYLDTSVLNGKIE